MGVQPSKTELFLPSDTLRRCDPDRCWCDRPYHRKSRYVYVERGGDGSERYHDPMDMMSNMMMGGMPSMPWKDPSLWTVRDFDRLGEVMGELYNRERGRGMNRNAPGHGPYPPWSAEQQPWDDGSGGRRRRSNRPGWTEYNRLEEQFRHMYDEYMRHRNENDSVLYGSDVDRRKDQYRYNMLKTLQEMWPQMSQMMMGGGQQGHMYGGQNHPMMQPPPQMMPPPPMQQNMYPPGPQYGMPPGGQYGMMHNGHNMHSPSMMPGNGMMEPGMGRRRRPPEPAFDTEHNEFEYTPFPRKHPMGRGRWNGGFGPGWDNGGTRSSDDPFGPSVPRRPGPGPGGGGGMGGGGMLFDRRPDRYRGAPMPSTPNDIPRVPIPVATELPRSSPLSTQPPDPLYTTQTPYPSSVYGAGHDYVSGGVPVSSTGNMRPGILRNPTYASQSMPYVSGEGHAYASGAMDGMQTGPDIVAGGRPGMPKSRVSFQPEAGLARPRDEEEARGEAEAGAPPSKRDGI